MHKRKRIKRIREFRENYRKELERMRLADNVISEEGSDLSKLTVKELKAIAEEKGIVDFNKMKKNELIDAIQSINELEKIVEETPEEVEELVVEVNEEELNDDIEEEISEEVVQAVADAIVEEAAEQDKEVEEVIKEIQEEAEEVKED